MDMPFYTRSKYLKIIFNLSKKIKSTYPAVQAFPSGARVFCSRKRHVETRKERTKWGESKGEGLGAGREKRLGLGLGFPPPPPFSSFTLTPTLRVTIFTLPNLSPS